MDFHALQQKLFEMDPTDPAEDKRRLVAQAQGNAPMPAKETVDYINESAAVAEGSLQMDKNYSVDDFAALAGVVTEKRQRPADQVRGSEPMPDAKPGREEHPFQDRLVGEQELDELEVVDRSQVQGNGNLQQSFQAINRQLQTLARSFEQLQTNIQQLTQVTQQMTQQAQQQSRQRNNTQQRQRQTVGLSDFPQMDLNSKKSYKQPLESLDNIKDSLYAALNKKMGN